MCKDQSAGDLGLSGRWNRWSMVWSNEAPEKGPGLQAQP